MQDFYTRVMGLTVTDRGPASSAPVDMILLSSDPGEEFDLMQRDPERASQLDRALAAQVATLTPCESGAEVVSDDDATERRLLEELGYIEGKPAKSRQPR